MSSRSHALWELNNAKSAVDREARTLAGYEAINKNGNRNIDIARHKRLLTEAQSSYDKALAKYQAEETAEAIARHLKY